MNLIPKGIFIFIYLSRFKCLRIQLLSFSNCTFISIKWYYLDMTIKTVISFIDVELGHSFILIELFSPNICMVIY